MKRRSWLTIAAIIVLGGVFAIHITSCSVFGYGIGSMVDSSRRTRFDPTTPTRIVTIEPGTEIEIRLDDGSTVSGHFEGWSLIADSTYAPNYTAWRERHAGEIRPPQLGDSVIVHAEESAKPARKSYSITSESIPPSRISADREVFGGWGPYSVILAPVGKPCVAKPLAEIDRLAHVGGDGVPRDSLLAWLSESPPPPMRITLRLDTAKEMQSYPAERVTLIAIGAPKSGKTIGAVVGFGVDLTILLAVAASYATSDAGCARGRFTGQGFSLRSRPDQGVAIPAQHRP